MGFWSMCLLGYKILAFIFLGFCGIGALALPISFVIEDENPFWLVLYLVTVPIVALCLKLIQLL